MIAPLQISASSKSFSDEMRLRRPMWLLLAMMVMVWLLAVGAETPSGTTARATFTIHTDAFALLGKASGTLQHRLIFAVQQRNTAQLEQLVLAVSDPTSPSYGQHLTRSEVATLTADPAATAAVLAFLNRTAGVRLVKVSLHGEYVVAVAPLAVWEELLTAAFFRVGDATATGSGSGGGSGGSARSAVRCLQYTLPPPLRGLVATVFNTVQTPDFAFGRTYRPRMRGRGPVDAATVAAIRAQSPTPASSSPVSAATALLPRASTDDGAGHRDDDPGVQTVVGTGDAQVRPRPDAARGEARAPLRLGLTYPALIAYEYGISGSGSTLTSQAVFASDEQVRRARRGCCRCGRQAFASNRPHQPPLPPLCAQVLALGDLELFQGAFWSSSVCHTSAQLVLSLFFDCEPACPMSRRRVRASV